MVRYLDFQFKEVGKLDFDRGKVPEGAQADALVERALFLAATGYWYTEVRQEITDKQEKTVRTRKQAPPNLTAVALWLSHRCPERWGDGAETPPENNLLALLRRELEGGDSDGISGLQPQAAPDDDLVAQP